MEWNDYRVILEIARARSVRGAARSLGVSHATVSRRLAYLNNRSEGPLVYKSPSGMWPTEFGAEVVKAAEQMERSVNQNKRRQYASKQALSGPLRISIPELVLRYLLLDKITEFKNRYPEIDLILDGTDTLVDLDKAESDVVVRVSDTPPEHWVGRRLFRYALSLYAHKDYLTGTHAEDRCWIAPPGDIARWSEWIGESPYPDVRVGLTIVDIAGRFQAIKQGLGMGRAACFMADPDPDLGRLPGAPLELVEEFWVLCHPDNAKNPKVQAAIAFFADAISARRDLLEGKGSG